MKCVSDIVYDDAEGLALDLYLPEKLSAEACILFVHGGGFRKGSRQCIEVGHFAHKLTQAGFAMAAISYRLGATHNTFSQKDASCIEAYMAMTETLGFTLPQSLYGPALIAAMEDISKAIEYLWVEGPNLGIKSRRVGVLGVSAGGIAGLAAAYPPTHWAQRISIPEAVVAISSAIVQPWRLVADGPPCLMIHGRQDRIIDIKNAEIGLKRAGWVSAPVTLVNTGVSDHSNQVDAVLDAKDGAGRPYIDIVLDHFGRLVSD